MSHVVLLCVYVKRTVASCAVHKGHQKAMHKVCSVVCVYQHARMLVLNDNQWWLIRFPAHHQVRAEQVLSLQSNLSERSYCLPLTYKSVCCSAAYATSWSSWLENMYTIPADLRPSFTDHAHIFHCLRNVSACWYHVPASSRRWSFGDLVHLRAPQLEPVQTLMLTLHSVLKCLCNVMLWGYWTILWHRLCLRAAMCLTELETLLCHRQRTLGLPAVYNISRLVES